MGCKEEDNVHKNYELLYTSLALITIELANEEVVIDLIRLAIALQVCFHSLSLTKAFFNELDTIFKVLSSLFRDMNFLSCLVLNLKYSNYDHIDLFFVQMLSKY